MYKPEPYARRQQRLVNSCLRLCWKAQDRRFQLHREQFYGALYGMGLRKLHQMAKDWK